MNLSNYQKDILKAFTETSRNITVDACPGSGKTTTIVRLAEEVAPFKKTLFLAFNKSIVKELERRLPSHIDVMTIHSYCMKTLLRYFRIRVSVKDNKSFLLIRSNLKSNQKFKNTKQEYAHYFLLSKMYDLYRMNLSNLDPHSISALAMDYDIDYESAFYEDFYNSVKIIEDYNNNNIHNNMMIDFTDMLWLIKDLTKNNFVRYDVVFIDEAQDLNPLQKYMIERVVKPRGRFVAVGDKKQSIYAFQGSSLDCFEGLMQMPNTINLPLSISYRCAKAIVNEANKVFENDLIEYHDSNEEGEVREGTIKEIEEGDYVLCRNNKPLVELWLELLKERKKASIYGRDYGDNLLKLLNSASDVHEDSMEEFFMNRLERLLEDLKSKGYNNPVNNPRYVHLQEQIEILTILRNHFGSYKELTIIIEDLFRDEIKGITLMTCHKSKGLENNRVFIYRKDLMPSPRATSTKMLRAEKCLAYVAITRAKKQLIYLK